MNPLVRVTVASGSRRVDLVVPGAIPVAELVPELARSVGLLDADTVHGGYRLVSSGGRTLAGDAGLTVQGVEDGWLLTVAPGVHDPPPRLYDDVAEAMADVIEREFAPWTHAAGRTTALIAAALFLGVGAAALLSEQSDLAAAGACLTAALLVLTSICTSRLRRDRGADLVVAWLGVGYAAVAGFLVAPEGAALVVQGASAGCGAVTAGAITLLGLSQGRMLVSPAIGIGGLFAAAGLATGATGLPPGLTFSTVLVMLVVAGSLFPQLALALAGRSPAVNQSQPVDLRSLAEDARLGHEILLALSVTLGGAVFLVAPVAAAGGPWGYLLAGSACVVLVLRSRRHHVGSEVLVGFVSGILGLVATATTILWLHPSCRSALAAAMVGGGGLLLARAFVASAPSVRRERLCDLAEFTALASLLPLLVLSAGAPDWVVW